MYNLKWSIKKCLFILIKLTFWPLDTRDVCRALPMWNNILWKACGCIDFFLPFEPTRKKYILLNRRPNKVQRYGIIVNICIMWCSFDHGQIILHLCACMWWIMILDADIYLDFYLFNLSLLVDYLIIWGLKTVQLYGQPVMATKVLLLYIGLTL